MKLRAIEFVMSQEKSKTMELELAKGLKKDFDTRFHPTWQCVVGNLSHYSYIDNNVFINREKLWQ